MYLLLTFFATFSMFAAAAAAAAETMQLIQHAFLRLLCNVMRLLSKVLAHCLLSASPMAMRVG
jgi:hypothetical protein